MRFQGGTVIVTGAGSGIGFEIATRFAAEGATVIAADIDADAVPASAFGVPVDVTDEASMKAMIATTLEITGRIDVLCNNAAIGSSADTLACSPADWDHVFAVNVRGVFLGTRCVLPTMLGAGRGAIVNMASLAALVGSPGGAAYTASKGAVVAFTRQVAIQYAPNGIRCNSVSPGIIDTPWVARALALAEDEDAVRAELAARHPLGRIGSPAEVAAAVLYLASEDAAFVTGSNLVIDGGASVS